MSDGELRRRIEELEQKLRAAERQTVTARAPGTQRSDIGSAPAIKLAQQQESVRSATLLRAIFESASDAVLIADDGGCYVDANPAACVLFGLAKEDLVGRRIAEFAAPGYVASEQWKTFVQPGTCGLRGEFPLLRADGTRHDLEFAAVPNVLPGLHLSILRDVTDRKAAETALQRMHEQLQTVLNNLPIIVFSIDRQGIYTLHDGKGVELVGLRAGQIVGQSVFERQRDTPGASDALRRALAGETVNGEFKIGPATFDCTCVPILDVDGAVSGATGVAIDVTARRSAEDLLRRSEARFRAMIEKSHDGITLLNADVRAIYQTPAVERLLGFTTDEARQKAWESYVHPDDLPKVRSALEHLLVGPSATISVEFQIYRKDGRRLWIELAATNLLHDPDVNAIVSNFRDITDRKHAEQELRALATNLQNAREAERTHLAREIHDELGQKLSAMKMDIGWIARRVAGADGNVEVAERLRALSELVDSTVSTVRRMALELRPAMLDDLGLPAALEWQAREFQVRSGIAVEFADDSSCEMVERITDVTATAFFRIFQELLTNVARHAGAKHVRVRLSCSDDVIMLEVSDDGRGFAAESVKGTPRGLGLVGIRERIALLGGGYTIEGGAGGGTIVKVWAPLKGVSR